MGSLDRLDDLADRLTAILEPVLAPPRRSKWAGPHRVDLIDTRQYDSDFLPGEMCLADPCLVSIKDRRRDVRLGLQLESGGKSAVIGAIDPADRSLQVESEPIAVEFQAELLAVKAVRARLPFLRRVFTHLATTSGFVVASAVDSQRIWLVEAE